MARRALLFLLIAASAAFSECGDQPVEVILEQEAPAVAIRVAGSDSVDCTVTIRARLGPTGKGNEVRWTEMNLFAAEPLSEARVWGERLDAEGAAARMGGDRLLRGEPRTAQIALRLPRAANASLTLFFQVHPSEGLVHGGRGTATTDFRCMPG